MKKYFKTNPTVRLINEQNATIKELNRKLRDARHQLRSERARANDYAHLLALSRSGSISHSDGGDVSSGADVHG